MKAVGVYIYAGNFSLGVRKHFDIEAHLEDPKPYGDDVIRMNPGYFAGMPIHPYPDWPNYYPDLLFANPPCAPFSNANTRSFSKDSWKNDSRISCWHNTAKYAIENNVAFVAIETVPQAYSKAPTMLLEKAEEFSYAGYQTMIFLHNAMFMGSCQNRPRLLFLASKYDIKLAEYNSKPTATVGSKLDEALPYLNSEHDFSIKCSEKYKACLETTEPGERLRDAWEKINPEESWQQNEQGQIKGRPTFGVKKLKRDEQMNVIVGYSVIHPDEPRYLTLKEYQTLGDFPPDYYLPRKPSSQSLVARGVSSKVGEWLGRTALLTLENASYPEDTNSLIIHDGLQGWDHSANYIQPISPEIVTLPDIGLRTRKTSYIGNQP
jgi:site-specific DNA-cytosine methylase